LVNQSGRAIFNRTNTLTVMAAAFRGRLSMRQAICLSAIILAALLAGPASAAEPGMLQLAQASPAPADKKLTGMEAWSQLVGNSITGKEDGETLVEYYAPDGTVKSMIGNEITTGTWALVGDTVCFKYPEEEIDCYKLEVIGNSVTMTDSSGDGSRYEILKGNPKSL
jgi:hypothetical protein